MIKDRRKPLARSLAPDTPSYSAAAAAATAATAVTPAAAVN